MSNNSRHCKFSCLQWRVFCLLFYKVIITSTLFTHTHTIHTAECIIFLLALCRKHFSPTPWKWYFQLCATAQAQSSRIRQGQSIKGCRPATLENLWSADNQLLSVEASELLASPTLKESPSDVPWYQLLQHVPTLTSPSVYYRSRAWASNAPCFLYLPPFCKMPKIRLVMLSLFYSLCSWFHTVTNAAWFWISAVKADCPNACRKQRAKWYNHGQGEFI